MVEQKKLNTEEERSTFLEGMGFEADENKNGLYRKERSDGAVMYWDFRKSPRGRFYVAQAFDDGGEFWSDKDAQLLPEYVEIRKVLGGEEKPPAKNKTGPLRENKQQQPVIRDTNNSSAITFKEPDPGQLRGTEDKILRMMDTKLHLDSIINASEDPNKPGEGLLWHELVFGKKIHREPSVELVDMITQDMGGITTRIVDFNTNTLIDPETKKKYLTYYCVVEAQDLLTKTTGLGAAEQLIDFSEMQRNGRTFARTNAIRKAERNAKERLIPVPRRALVELIIRKLRMHQKTRKTGV